MKKAITIILRAALIVAPLTWIYANTNITALTKTLSTVNAPLVFAIIVLLFGNMLLQGVKWWTLIRRFVPELKMSKAVSAHIESAFYSLVMPSIGQDVIKSVMLSRDHPPQVIWAATWFARLLGLFPLLFFSILGLVYLDNDILPAGFRTSIITVIIALAALLAISFSKRITRPIRAIAAKFLSPKIMDKIEKLRDGVYIFKYARGTLLLTLLIGAVVQFMTVFLTFLVIFAISDKFYFIECLAFVPMVEIMVVALPITPGGIGIREGLMALMFTRLDFNGEQIAAYVTISLLGSMVRVAGGIPPLYRMVAKRKTLNPKAFKS